MLGVRLPVQPGEGQVDLAAAMYQAARMQVLRKLLTPAGALAMLVGLWLPWADVSCAQIHTNPDFWQLARYDHRLYALLALVAVITVCGVWYLVRAHKGIAWTALAGSLAAVAAWCYLWWKKDELAAYQAQLASGGGDLGRMLQELRVETAAGFKLYLGGALLAALGAVLYRVRGASDSPR